jgi:CubicO group peptidase (beta-lactamase class C family)
VPLKSLLDDDNVEAEPIGAVRLARSEPKIMVGTGSSELRPAVDRIANGWPCVGLAVGVIRGGGLESFCVQGLADIAARTPLTKDTVFRIASITKTFTAIAVMQLWEQGAIDLDRPANAYLRAYRLVPARPGLGEPTVRHLLTHTAGIREVLHLSGLLRMRDLGETVEAGRPVPSLAEFYGGALRYDAEPGTTFTYTNHGFATLGQIIEDLSGRSLDDYFRDNIFKPLGMADTGLRRPEVGSPCAQGYELRAHGVEPVPDYDLIPRAAGGVYSTPRNVARFVAALLGGGRNDHGAVLEPASLASMFEPHFQPDPRLPGFGLAFFRTDLGGHLAVEHDGILPGFDSQMLLAPNDGVGVIAFANGAKRGMHWLVPETQAILRELLAIPADAIRTDVPQRPEIWGELTGWYRTSTLGSDPARFVFGPGVEVAARGGRLILRPLSPIPTLLRGFVLHPDDPEDPYVFRIDVPWFGVGTTRVAFSADPGGRARAVRLELAPISFVRQPRNKGRGRSVGGRR